MLELKDFFHLPQLDSCIEQIVADGPGLMIVAGLDPRPSITTAATGGFLPSGRSTIFRILMRQLLARKKRTRAMVVAEHKNAVRVPRTLRRQIEVSLAQSPSAYADLIHQAIYRRPDLLLIDHLTPDTAALALEAARNGLRVLTQMDTVFRGVEVVRALRDMGVKEDSLGGLQWVLAVQRLPALCPKCKRLAAAPDDVELGEFHRRYHQLFEAPDTRFYEAAGCAHCHHTGRYGDVAAFDVFRGGLPGLPLTRQPSQLSLEEYLLRLAAAGHLPLSDVTQLQSDQLRRTYHMLTASEQELSRANATMRRKLAELEAANQVLQQRTEALVSLQDVGQALISSTDLDDLSTRVCRRACDICCADKAVLYFLRSPEEAEILAVNGWDPALVHKRLEAKAIARVDQTTEPAAFSQPPPGFPQDALAKEPRIRAGLHVPLVAQEEWVGLMLVHTTQASRFAPAEISLLQMFANHAALAIQRAGLVEELLDKISELETAHGELAQKERMEHELDLARQVQQSVLPHTFPPIAGFQFAAMNEPARRVGGDFYDVILLDDDHFGLVVGDVSDKGMPSALYMALTRSLLLAEARREYSPAAVLSNVNQLLLELGQPNMFVSVFYGVVEMSTRQMTYARAGHDYPLLLNGQAVRELQGQGTILGMFDPTDLSISEEHIAMTPQDRLVLYTDGLTDVVSDDGRLFSRERLKSLLRSRVHLSAEEMVYVTFAELSAFKGTAEQFDDMTMLVVALD